VGRTDGCPLHAKGLGVRVRVGIHTGEVEQAGATLSGLAVHIAARIAALRQGDDILVSQTVRDIVAGSGLSFVEHGCTL
jgi:class 3 adenylate cyclase